MTPEAREYSQMQSDQMAAERHAALKDHFEDEPFTRLDAKNEDLRLRRSKAGLADDDDYQAPRWDSHV